MTIRTFLAKHIPAFWLSALLALALVAHGAAGGAPQQKAPAKPASKKTVPKSQPAPPAQDLSVLVHAYRGDGSAAHRDALERYATAHAKDSNGPLAHLALGIATFERKDFAAAVTALKAAKVPELADYTGYYLAAARVEAHDYSEVSHDLAPAHSSEPLSPLDVRAWLVEARALSLSGNPAGAVSLLREHYGDLPQPEGDITLADCYLAAKDRASAAAYYQRVYYGYISGDASLRAAAGISALRGEMGASYPAASAELQLRRADRFMEVHDYIRAWSEYRAVSTAATGLERDQARVRIGAAQYLAGNTSAAYPYLDYLVMSESEADAERLYYLAECARRMGNDDAMMGALKKLGARYPKSSWRLKTLITAANRYLLAHQPDDYVPLFKAACQDFPGDPNAALYHWKVTFDAWMRNPDGAAGLLRDHLREYPAHWSNGAALYFLGRAAERDEDAAAAKAIYQRLTQALQNTYYAMLARERLARAEISTAAHSEKTAAFLATLNLRAAQPVPAEPSHETALRIARALLLRTAGLNDFADSELRFGARTDGQAALLGMEAASWAGSPRDAMRWMKALAPDNLNLALDAAPRKFWEYLFPFPYREFVTEDARAQNLDPFLIAGLVRQESEFDPTAVSHAKAYGLAQVLPATGRLYLKEAGLHKLYNRDLYSPAINLKMGTIIFRHMLDDNGGHIEPTLAAYNAGPNRAAEWIQWNSYREPAEFVESIPFTETREYVQAVLRNADMYRRLYSR